MQFKRFGSYNVYENGTVYSLHNNKFLKPDITKYGYHQYSLSENGVPERYRAHRLVAMLFITNDNPHDKVSINHIDGDKDNNHYSNLEWCTNYYNNKHARDMGLNDISKSNRERWECDDFRKRVSNNISEGLKRSGAMKGEGNPMFRYQATIDGRKTDRHELKEILNMSLSSIDRITKDYCNGKIHQKLIDYNVSVVDTKNDKIKGQQTNESIA